MTELTNGIWNTFKNVAGTSSLTLAVIFFIGHIYMSLFPPIIMSIKLIVHNITHKEMIYIAHRTYLQTHIYSDNYYNPRLRYVQQAMKAHLYCAHAIGKLTHVIVETGPQAIHFVNENTYTMV